MRLGAVVVAIALALSVSACSGGRGTSALMPAAPAGQPPSSGTRVVMKMIIPKAASASSHRRRPTFVSPSTDGVLVVSYAHSDTNHTTALGTAVTDVSNGSAACAPAAASRSCSVNIVAPAGVDDFVFTLYDMAPVNGAIPAAAHELGTAGVTQTITAGAANVVNAGIGAVIVGLSGQAALVQLAADGSVHDIGLTIAPADFGDNPITAGSSNSVFANPIVVAATESGGSGHSSLELNGGTPAAQVTVSKSTDTVQVVYDGQGAPGYQVSVSLTAPAFAGEGPASETAVIEPVLFVSNPTVFWSPAPATLNAYPEGQHLLAINEPTAANGTVYTATLTGCSNILRAGTVIGTGTSATLLLLGGTTLAATGCSLSISDGTFTFPIAVTNALRADSASHTITEYATTATQPFGIATGTDGNLWFAENNPSSPAISKITPDGTGYTKYSLVGAGWVSPFGVTLGPDGNVWVGDDNSNPGNAGRVTTAGTSTTYHTAHVFTNFDTAGLDGNVWFSECSSNALSSVSTSGTVTPFAPAGGSNIQGITLGPDGNIWFTDIGTRHIGTVVAGVASELSAGTFANQPSTAEDIYAGSDGNLWVSEEAGGSSSRIAQVSTSGTILNEFSTSGSTTIGNANFITAGPDGALWFTDNGNNAIGRITTSGTINEFTIPTASSNPNGITVGPDGNLWFTEGSTHKIGTIKL
jgi:streptogramin lyase